MHVIDCLQYCNWSEKIFRQMREGGVDAVHVTIAYHEMFRETVANIEQWNRWFELSIWGFGTILRTVRSVWSNGLKRGKGFCLLQI